jgi:hypothetical protein
MCYVSTQKWLSRLLCGFALAAATSLCKGQGVNDQIVNQFDDGTVGGWAANYGNAPMTLEHDPNENRGPGATPGALKVTINFDLCTYGGGNQRDWERSLAQALDLTKFTKLHMSVKVDPSSSHLSDWGAGALGSLRPHIRKSDWGGDSNLGSNPDNVWVGTDAYGNWVDYTYTIDQTLANEPTRLATGVFGFDMWSGWGNCAAPIGHTNTVTFWIDNIWFEANTNTAPVPPPTLALRKAGPSGVEITVDDNGSQWQRDAISTPSDAGACFWGGNGSSPVTYSFTIADFPDPVVHEGFEAHLYIVNRDTTTGFEETYGGADWNAPNIAIVSLQSLANGTYSCQFQFKTNLPNANPLDDAIHRPATLISSSVLGTWSLSFVNDTNVTLTAPGGGSTNFTIPPEAVQNNFSPGVSFIQLGVHKNDNENNGHNNQTRATFSRFRKTGGSYEFDDTFNGNSLTSNVAWRRTSATAVQHVPPGSAWVPSWTVPATGFSLINASNVTGPYNPAGATSTYLSGGRVHAIVPASALPSASATYFAVVKRPFTKLQVLLPGETAAPNTVSGKTGTPTSQSAGVPFVITVNACDTLWNVVASSDTVNITSTDGTATLPADAALVGGTANFTVTLNSSGSWTMTATDVTDGTKTPGTSSAVTVP